MAKYRKKPEFVEAFCFGKPKNEPSWFRQARVDGKIQMVVDSNILNPSDENYSAIIQTAYGNVSAFSGDYVVLDSQERLLVVPAMEFFTNYEEVK